MAPDVSPVRRLSVRSTPRRRAGSRRHRRRGRRQEHDGAGNVLDLSDPAQWDPLLDLAPEPHVGEEPLGQRCAHERRRDAVHTDAAVGELECEGLRERLDRVLAGDVHGPQLVPYVPELGGDVDDRARPTVRHHRSDDLLGQAEDRAQVQLQEPVEGCGIHLEEWSGDVRPRVVHQDVHGTGGSDDMGQGRLICDVSLDARGAAALREDLVTDQCSLLAATGHHRLGARQGQCDRAAAADAAPGACHEGTPAVQSEHGHEACPLLAAWGLMTDRRSRARRAAARPRCSRRRRRGSPGRRHPRAHEPRPPDPPRSGAARGAASVRRP